MHCPLQSADMLPKSRPGLNNQLMLNYEGCVRDLPDCLNNIWTAFHARLLFTVYGQLWGLSLRSWTIRKMRPCIHLTSAAQHNLSHTALSVTEVVTRNLSFLELFKLGCMKRSSHSTFNFGCTIRNEWEDAKTCYLFCRFLRNCSKCLFFVLALWMQQLRLVAWIFWAKCKQRNKATKWIKTALNVFI